MFGMHLLTTNGLVVAPLVALVTLCIHKYLSGLRVSANRLLFSVLFAQSACPECEVASWNESALCTDVSLWLSSPNILVESRKTLVLAMAQDK